MSQAKCALANFRKRRGVVKASITRLDTRLKALEASRDEDTGDNAKQILSKLRTRDTEFKDVQMSMIDLIDDEASLETEQAVLDEHDDVISSITLRIQKLIASINPLTDTKTDVSKILTRRLKCLYETLSTTGDAINVLTGAAEDVHCLKLHEEKLADYKRELAELRLQLLSLDLDESDELIRRHAKSKMLLLSALYKLRN